MRAPQLETERLRLEPARLTDAPALHALWTDPNVRRYLWDDVVIDRARAEHEVRRGLVLARRGLGDWLVHERESAAWVGWAALRGGGEAGEDPELLWALWPAHQGYGYATEAARALVDHAFRALGATRVVAGTDPPNVASLRVMDRLGMRFLEERRIGDLVAVYHCISREHHEQASRPIA